MALLLLRSDQENQTSCTGIREATRKRKEDADAKSPIMAFPGHLAPNDLLFYTGNMFPEKYKNGAFIAFHGSWNRAPLVERDFMLHLSL
jgi:glucose/arabinose dehydrogenase